MGNSNVWFGQGLACDTKLQFSSGWTSNGTSEAGEAADNLEEKSISGCALAEVFLLLGCIVHTSEELYIS